MRLWLFILLFPVLAVAQPFQRQFFTTNTAPWVLISPGTNCFVTYHLLGGQTNQFVIDIPASGGGQTNVTILSQGTNVFVHSTTNNGVITYTIDVPTQPQQTNWALANITNLTALQIAWQQITNVSSMEIPLASITNLSSLQISWQQITNIATVQIPWASITNPPSVQTQWPLSSITNANNLTNWALLGTNQFIASSGGNGTNISLFNNAAPALTLHGGFLSTNDVTGSVAIQTNGTLQLSNASVAYAIGLGNTNVLEVDTVPLKSALAVDTNGTVFVKSLTDSRLVLSSATDGLTSAAAGGAVPANLDGSATTAAQLKPLVPIGGPDINIAEQTASFFDDFFCGAPTATSRLGIFEWLSANSGSGSVGIISGRTNAPGIWQLSIGASPSVAGIVNNAGVRNYKLRGIWTNEWRFFVDSLNQVGVAGDNYAFYIGLGEKTDGTQPAFGCYLQYDTNSLNFKYITANSTSTTNDSTVTVQTLTWYKFRVVVTVNSLVTNAVFSINGSNLATNTTNIPDWASNDNTSGVCLEASGKKIDGANTVKVNMDYCFLGYTLEVSR